MLFKRRRREAPTPLDLAVNALRESRRAHTAHQRTRALNLLRQAQTALRGPAGRHQPATVENWSGARTAHLNRALAQAVRDLEAGA